MKIHKIVKTENDNYHLVFSDGIVRSIPCDDTVQHLDYENNIIQTVSSQYFQHKYKYKPISCLYKRNNTKRMLPEENTSFKVSS
jgi:hypothetical protein